MADTDDFASVDDLEASWHALTDEEKTRAKKLIAYASDLIRSYRRWDKVSNLTRERICCAAVRRAMEADSNGAPSGASSMSETAGPFQAPTASRTPPATSDCGRARRRSLAEGDASSREPST